MAEETPVNLVKPLGQSVFELVRLPVTVLQDIQPELQSQINELPNTIRNSAKQFVKDLQSVPDNIRQGNVEFMRQMNPGEVAARVISPFPLPPKPNAEAEANKS